MLSLGWPEPENPVVGPHHLRENGGTAAAEREDASVMLCIQKSVSHCTLNQLLNRILWALTPCIKSP